TLQAKCCPLPHLSVPLSPEVNGPGGGSYFYIKGEEQGEIQGIRVFVGVLGLIKGIQLRFGSHWSPRYGAPGGRAEEFLLQEGERVTAVHGSARACVWHLRWITSRGREAAFGHPAGLQLLTVNGQHQLFCLSAIGFKWGSPKKGRVSHLPF
uniref:Jacalin-type lectin domain-containing protein n=1 Tax=Castor canadensis TaxID=51338 RepID=A0A8C0ZTY8_CASCN